MRTRQQQASTVAAKADLTKILAAIRAADGAMDRLRADADSAAERELVLMRGLIHEIRNALQPVKFHPRSATTALARIGHLVELAKPGPPYPERTSVSIAELVGRLRALVAKHRGVVYRVVTPRIPAGSTEIDPREVDIVLSTILHNAEQAQQQCFVRISFDIPRRQLVVRVAGAQRGPVKRRVRRRGWGIGLWTAAVMLERAGGELTFEQGPSGRKGSVVFTVSLPVSIDSPIKPAGG